MKNKKKQSEKIWLFESAQCQAWPRGHRVFILFVKTTDYFILHSAHVSSDISEVTGPITTEVYHHLEYIRGFHTHKGFLVKFSIFEVTACTRLHGYREYVESKKTRKYEFIRILWHNLKKTLLLDLHIWNTNTYFFCKNLAPLVSIHVKDSKNYNCVLYRSA